MPESLPWDQFTNNNPVSADSAEPVLIIGAGLAGCWMARTLAEHGIRVTVLEAGSGPACGASSNPAGITKPFVTRSPSLAMEFHVQASRYLVQRLNQWDLAKACGYKECGVIQLVEKPYPDSAHYRCLSPQQMTEIIGVQCKSQGLLFEKSGWLNPSALCHALLQHSLIDVHYHYTVKMIKRLPDASWEVHDDQLSARRSSHLVISTGAAITHLPLSEHLPITPARGQISRFINTNQAQMPTYVISGKHYFIPDGNSVIIGATFERGDFVSSLKAEDNQSNLTGIRAMLPALSVGSTLVEAYAGVRATTPDRLPLIGPIPDTQACRRTYADIQHGRALSSYPALPSYAGAYVFGGLGSRGIVTAPFAAKVLADHLLGGSEISQWSPLINPARFQIRQLKRGRTA